MELTPQQRLKVRTYHSTGACNEEIAEKVGISVQSVASELERVGFRPHIKDKPKNVIETPKSVSKVPQSVIELVKNSLEILKYDFAGVSEEYHKMRADIEEFEGFIEREGYNVQCK